MLDAGVAPRQIAGLSVFVDHADPQLFYLLADAPRVRADPRPQLSLTLFRGDAAGALLELETVLAPTPEQLEEVRRTLEAEGGAPPRLGRPDFREGTVELAGWMQTDELRPLTVSMGPPSLVGDPSAIVAARLDAAAAAMIEQALREGDALPTAVLYRLELLGLAGPLGIEVEADLRRVHDRLVIEGALTSPIGRARLAKTWDELATQEVVRVRVLDESGDVESRRAEALTRVGEDLVAKMLQATPPASRPATPAAPGAAVELSFRLSKQRDELETTARWSYHERSVRRIVHHAAANLIGVLGDSPIDEHVTYVDLAPPRRELVVRTEPELPALGITALEVELWLGEAPPEDGDEPPNDQPVELEETRLFATLTAEQGEVRLPVRREAAMPLWHRVRARFDPERTHAADRGSGWQPALGSTVVLSPRRLFAPRSLTVVTGRLELDWLDHVEVQVAAPDPEEPARTLVLSGERRSARADFLAAGEGPLTVTASYRGKDDEPSLAEPPREVADDEELLVLDGPFAPSVRVLVVPLPVAGVLSIVTELELRHDDWVQTRSVSWDLPDTSSRTVALRRPRGVESRYRYRSTMVHDDGRVEVGEWVESEAPALVVGAEGEVVVHRVEVYVPGGPLARGALAMELLLASGEASTSAVLEGSADAVELVLVAPKDGPEPVLSVDEILLSGESRRREIHGPSAHEVIVGTDPED
ncbi:MAG: hypothetical protein H6712_23295 [Myxococcales bacterium]|nr:hypothetical protein [Myxococcales bacterium]